MSNQVTWLNAPASGEQVDTVQKAFREKYGYESQGVWSAPGRVNLIGEHVDYCGGTVMPFALPHRTFVAAAPRSDTVLRAFSLQTGEVLELDLAEVEPGKVSGWISYVAGVPWAMKEENLAPLVGADLVIDSAVPLGGGLSSSAALECSVALVFDAFATEKRLQGFLLSSSDAGRAQLATACIRAENEIAGANTGGMDQSISLRAQEGSVLAIDCRDFSTQSVTVDVEAENFSFLVIDTKAPHQLADGQYAQRRQVCEFVAELMQVSLLRDLLSENPSRDEVENLLSCLRQELASAQLPQGISPESAFAMTRHVLSEIERVCQTVKLFAQPTNLKSLIRLGQLLNASHASLRDDFKVSVPELDTACEVALEAGALGARMVGGGFGGSVLALVKTEDLDTVAQEITRAFASRNFNKPVFLKALPSTAAHREI